MSTSDRTRHQYSDEPREILLVEDHSGDVRLLREAFSETNTQTKIHVVNDGEAAITFLKRASAYESEPVPELVLLDLNLPGRGGREVLEDVREDLQIDQLPVIILTSSEDSEDVVQCYEAAANAYLTKPTSLDNFVSMVETIERFWFSHARLPPM